jgi:GT2 family glycosyltransferase
VSPSAGETAARAPRITVAFLLYNAAGDVDALLQGLVRQAHPSFARQSDWLDAVFVDDASGDGTAEAVTRALAGIGSLSHYRLVVHPRNLGLAETLNETFRQVPTPFVLTCHLDCRFGSDHYVAAMLDLIEAHPRAAAITGQPELPPGTRLPFAEKLNVVANLMDIFPAETTNELVPVGFAEGRCDVFRAEALREVGLYDTRLRVSGEDQVLAAKLRDRGYELYQAPRLAYHLSVSAEQDSVGKILRHLRLFGRTTPYIVLRVSGSRDGLVGPSAGANRNRRALLRATQLAASAVYALVPLILLPGWPRWAWGSGLVLVAAARAALFAGHARAVRFSGLELVAFVLVQPLLDLAYTAGILEGLLGLARGGRSHPID